MSYRLADARGGVRMEVTDPSACGALLSHERESDEVVYRQRELGEYYFDPISDDFEVMAIGSA